MNHRLRIVATIFVLLASAFLLFFALGRYILWDDEASQALIAEQVWKTGDTSAVVGRNLVAYDQGAELENLHDRATPPLTAFFMAPFVGANTMSALRARLPMALCGFFFIVLLLRWLWRSRADGPTWILFSLAIVGNVSLFLFFRQARYYGINLLCSLAIGYLYLRWNGSKRALLAISGLMFCLLATHYMTYAAVSVALAVDYFVWRRKERSLTPAGWAILLIPQFLAGAVVVAIWNPFATGRGGDLFSNTLAQRAELFWWNLRDLNRCEFGAGLLLLVAPFVSRRFSKNSILLRGFVAMAVYCAVIAVVSPKVVAISGHVADVRYLIPLIPLCIAMSAITLRVLIGRRTWLALPLGLAAFGTNLFNFGPWLPEGFRSTLLCELSELKTPVPGPYGITIRWIDEHVPAGASIWVNPGYAAFPLMYRAPHPIYAWQLTYPPQPQFAGLETIHFFGIEPPDYLIAFGPYVGGTIHVVKTGRRLGFIYERVATLDRYWDTVPRPGLISHYFKKVTSFDRKTEAIYIYQRVKPPALSR